MTDYCLNEVLSFWPTLAGCCLVIGVTSGLTYLLGDAVLRWVARRVSR